MNVLCGVRALDLAGGRLESRLVPAVEHLIADGAFRALCPGELEGSRGGGKRLDNVLFGLYNKGLCDRALVSALCGDLCGGDADLGVGGVGHAVVGAFDQLGACVHDLHGLYGRACVGVGRVGEHRAELGDVVLNSDGLYVAVVAVAGRGRLAVLGVERAHLHIPGLASLRLVCQVNVGLVKVGDSGAV